MLHCLDDSLLVCRTWQRPLGAEMRLVAADQMTACLERGRWEHGVAGTRNLTVLLSPSSKYLCIDRRAERLHLERRKWQGTSPLCKDIVEDPLESRFNGTFSMQPVDIAFMGDSVGQQVQAALIAAVTANPHLAGRFRLASTLSACKLTCNLATIPRSAAGCRAVLDGIVWPDQGKHSHATRRADRAGDRRAGAPAPKRILLAGSGMWYNLKPYCNGTSAGLFGLGAKAACEHVIMGHHIRPDDLSLTDDKPLRLFPRQFWRAYHQHFGTPPWGWYSWGRRLKGTATIAEYRDDVRTFLDAALEWSRNNSGATIVWLESTPQHFAPPPADGGVAVGGAAGGSRTPHHSALAASPAMDEHERGSAGAARAGRGGVGRAGLTARGCQEAPATPMEAGRPPAELDALCGMSDGARGGAISRGRGRPLTECTGDWRNHIARPLLAERGIAVVPLAAALSDRAHLHTGGGGDCTHWCIAFPS